MNKQQSAGDAQLGIEQRVLLDQQEAAAHVERSLDAEFANRHIDVGELHEIVALQISDHHGIAVNRQPIFRPVQRVAPEQIAAAAVPDHGQKLPLFKRFET